MALLQQLLQNESLSSSWRDIIVSLVCQVVQTVRPDVKHQDDDMDIRQFVHIKKVSYCHYYCLLLPGTDGEGLIVIYQVIWKEPLPSALSTAQIELLMLIIGSERCLERVSELGVVRPKINSFFPF